MLLLYFFAGFLELLIHNSSLFLSDCRILLDDPDLFSCVFELAETIGKFKNLNAKLFLLLLDDLSVTLKQLYEVGWRHVEDALELGLHLGSRLLGGCM